MKSSVLFSLVVLVAAAGCAGSEYEPWLTRGQPREADADRSRFALERTACFGVCPVYKVIVDERDIMEFRGERFVAEEGGAVGRSMPEGTFDRLVDVAEAYDFDAFDAAYPNEDGSNCPQYATDMPSVVVTLERGGEARSVSVYQGCMGFAGRDRFDAMVLAMDEILDLGDMIGPRDAFLVEPEQ